MRDSQLQRMKKNRNEVQIIFELLGELNDGNSQTSSLLRRVNIPFSKYQELLDRLKERGLVDITMEGNKNSINLTDKGREFIEQYRKFSKLMERSYGLTL